ncbi:MAG: GntR family transcriptional regulator [Clostridium fessum]
MNERKLSEELGISRTPIREGMQMLARDGWLQMETYKGTVVREFDPHYMWELTRVRSALELSAIEDAAKNITENDLKCLEEIQEKQKEVLEHYDITRFIQLDREFHTYIYQMSQNRELLKLLSNYYDMFRFMGMQAVMGTDKRRQTTIDEHIGNFRCIETEKCGSGSSGDENPYGGDREKYQPESCNGAECQIKLEDHPKKDSGFCEKSKLTIKDKGVIILIAGIPNTEYQISQKIGGQV